MGRRNPRSSYILWILAGGYLLYITYSLIKGYMAGESPNLILTVVASLVFGIVGAVLFVVSFKGLYQLKKGTGAEESNEADEIEKSEISGEMEQSSEKKGLKDNIVSENDEL